MLCGWVMVGLCIIKEREIVLYRIGRGFRGEGERYYSLGVMETFEVVLKLGLVLGAVVTTPLLCLQVYVYVSRGLTGKERGLLRGVLCSIMGLMIVGVVVAVEWLGPWIWRFMDGFRGEEVEYMITIGDHVRWLTKVVMAGMMVMQVPVLLWAMIRWEWLSRGSLERGRGWIMFVVLLVAGLVTPPDVGSQVMLFIPTMSLYELWLVSRLYRRYKKGVGLSG